MTSRSTTTVAAQSATLGLVSKTRGISVFGVKGIVLAASMAIGVPVLAQPYSSTNRDVLSQNTGAWSAAGVTLNGRTFVVKGLQGVGRVAASFTQTFDGGLHNETLGSISDMQITNWVKNGDGTYSGVFNFLPDRGFNSGATFSNYAARINTFDFTFTPHTSTATTTSQNQIVTNYTGSTRFTYDHDNSSGTAAVFTTGLVADSATTSLFGQPVPTVSTSTTIGSDGPLTNRLTLDTEGLILDPRAGKQGGGWIGDEYGAFIYHFDANKQIDGIVTIPQALVPHSPAGTTNFQADPPANGRRINQGMEGIAISPDGTRLFAMLQSATIQDSGSGNQGRTNARVLVYDISSGVEVPTDPIEQYVVQLPRIDTDLNGSVDRAGAQSGILAVSNHELLILSRDGNGRGANNNAPVFKSVLMADLTSGTNLDGLFDSEGVNGDLTSSGDIFKPGIVAAQWIEALNILGKLDQSVTELEQFGLNLLANDGDANTLSEKWEAMALVPTLDGTGDYFLFIGNDNDFQTATGFLTQADGTTLSYDAGLENDTMVLAFRVSVPEPSSALLVASGLIGLFAVRRRARG